MTISNTIKCGKCEIIIDDDSSPSIMCDICEKWYHGDKKCSGLKKTLFNNIKKNDQWACPTCINHFKTSSNLCKDEIAACRLEIDSLLKLNRDLTEQNNKFLNDLNLKENLIVDLTDRLKVLEDKCETGRGDVETWSVAGRGSGLRPRREVLGSALHTSNSFEVLADVETTERRTLVDSEFPPLGKPKRDGATKGKSSVPKSRPREPRRTKKREVIAQKLFQKNPCSNKPKLTLVGDSHGRGCALRLGERVKKWDVSSWIMPGAPLAEVIRKMEGCHGGGDDFLVVIGGTNQVTEQSVHELNDRLNGLGTEKGNILWVETPIRHDKPAENVMIGKQNEVIKSACIKNKWSFLKINDILDRTCYTKHGLHLNRKGKNTLISIIESFFLSLSTQPQAEPQSKNEEPHRSTETT